MVRRRNIKMLSYENFIAAEDRVDRYDAMLFEIKIQIDEDDAM